jgi:hypothetical protein
MYTKSPRPYKHEYAMQKKRGEHEDRMERQRARRALDKKGVDRKGKDIDHIKPLSKGGTNTPSNLRVVSKSANRSFPRNSDRSLKKNT